MFFGIASAAAELNQTSERLIGHRSQATAAEGLRRLTAAKSEQSITIAAAGGTSIKVATPKVHTINCK